jgi:2'-hydroxyisoflavone reductase
MKLLILGGGVFLGRALLDAALGRGHAVSVFNRGRARQDWPADVQVLRGDRRGDLSALAGGGWDAVIDTCGYAPADIAPTAQALAGCARYLFVSSISAYASLAEPGQDERASLASAEGLAADAAVTGETYGPLKAECERVLTRLLGERLIVVRPGLIVGPGDPSGRFSYWPWRAAGGGAMLVPAVAASARLQFIDVRDLAAWMLALLEAGAHGVFNATGPAGADALGWDELIEACRAGARAIGSPVSEPVAVPEALLLAQGVAPWTELPLWMPSSDAETAGLMTIDITRAVGAGLRTRPLAETVQAVLAEGIPAADDPRIAAKLSRAREAELIALARRGSDPD